MATTEKFLYKYIDTILIILKKKQNKTVNIQHIYDVV